MCDSLGNKSVYYYYYYLGKNELSLKKLKVSAEEVTYRSYIVPTTSSLISNFAFEGG